MKKLFLYGKHGSIIGNYALVDNDDYSNLITRNWFVNLNSYNNIAAVVTNSKKGDKEYLNRFNHKAIYIHRLIMNVKNNMVVDHIDGNPLNNQKKNLRICFSSENSRNCKLQKNNTSGFRGVTFNKQNKKWIAQITFNYKVYYLGSYTSKIQAAKKYDKIAIKFYKEFYKPNFPNEKYV